MPREQKEQFPSKKAFYLRRVTGVNVSASQLEIRRTSKSQNFVFAANNIATNNNILTNGEYVSGYELHKFYIAQHFFRRRFPN